MRHLRAGMVGFVLGRARNRGVSCSQARRRAQAVASLCRRYFNLFRRRRGLLSFIITSTTTKIENNYFAYYLLELAAYYTL